MEKGRTMKKVQKAVLRNSIVMLSLFALTVASRRRGAGAGVFRLPKRCEHGSRRGHHRGGGKYPELQCRDEVIGFFPFQEGSAKKPLASRPLTIKP